VPWNADDLATLFDPDMPGYAEATFAGGLVVGGRYQRDYAEALGAQGFAPVFKCPESAVATVAVGDSLTVNDEAFVVGQKRPDGRGGVALLLETP